ncbi:MAG: N-acetylmuramoyl-L-alanine amidase [Bacteroidales bacterium]|nr:N-acetylmuramoyl-L-alanine amidase [Bacteroidales bacterium]
MTNKVLCLTIISAIALLISSPLHISGQNVSGQGLKTVVIDPGHGGKDPGAPGKSKSTAEKNIVLNISKLFGDKIKAEYPDVKVVYTRSTDVFVELKERANIAKRNNADLFISVHCNSSTNSKAFGASAHILGPKSNNPKNTSDYFEKSKSVAQRENSVMLLEDDYQTAYQDFDPNSPEAVISHSLLWQANYGNSLLFAAEYDAQIHKAPYRVSNYTGIHQDVFYLLWATNMPAALLEVGFLSNPSDYAVLSTADGQEKIAKSLFNAFKSYKEKYDASVGALPAVSESTPEPEPSTVNEESASPKQETAPVQKEEADKNVTSTPSKYYGIQIMGLGRLLKNGDSALKGLQVQAVKAEGSSIYKYIYGKHATRAAAAAELSAVKKKFPEAFVVEVNGDNVKISK